MFGFGKKDKLIKELHEANCQLAGELCEAKDDAKTYAGMADQRMQTINAMKERITETVEERDAMSESVDQLHNSCRTLEAENAQLRDGAGHALHALAAVQDLSTAFVKRLDMLPPYCGLPQDLVQSVFAGFDKDLQARKDLVREIEKQSVTIEAYADDSGALRVSPRDNTKRNLTDQEIQAAFFGPNGHASLPDHIKPTFEVEISSGKIDELGLYTVKIDLGKNVEANGKLWVVPNAEGLET